MPTPIDRALQSRNLFFGFAGSVVLASLWSIWGTEMFPPEKDPKGDPQTWTETEMRRWLDAVSQGSIGVWVSMALLAGLALLAVTGMWILRGLLPSGKATREELLERVKANMRPKGKGKGKEENEGN